MENSVVPKGCQRHRSKDDSLRQNKLRQQPVHPKTRQGHSLLERKAPTPQPELIAVKRTESFSRRAGLCQGQRTKTESVRSLRRRQINAFRPSDPVSSTNDPEKYAEPTATRVSATPQTTANFSQVHHHVTSTPAASSRRNPQSFIRYSFGDIQRNPFGISDHHSSQTPSCTFTMSPRERPEKEPLHLHIRLHRISAPSTSNGAPKTQHRYLLRSDIPEATKYNTVREVAHHMHSEACPGRYTAEVEHHSTLFAQ